MALEISQYRRRGKFRRGEEKVDEIKFKLVVYNESAHADSRQLPETPRVSKCPWGSDLFNEDLREINLKEKFGRKDPDPSWMDLKQLHPSPHQLAL